MKNASANANIAGSVKKAVIPVAGLGTRFLPASKNVAKELFPIVDKPILLYNVEEIVSAGIEELILVTGPGKTSIEEFFKPSKQLEDALAKSGKSEWLDSWRSACAKIKVTSVRQEQPLGLGHAVLCAATAVGGEAFALLLGDEIMISKHGKKSGIGQLIHTFEQTGVSTVAVMKVPDSDIHKYGMVQVEKTQIKENLWKILDVVEKPGLLGREKFLPNNFALPGRYVFSPAIFDRLREIKPGRNGELQLTDAMTLVAKEEGLLSGLRATILDTVRYDAGDKLGYLVANVELGMQHPEIGEAFQAYLKTKFGGRL